VLRNDVVGRRARRAAVRRRRSHTFLSAEVSRAARRVLRSRRAALASALMLAPVALTLAVLVLLRWAPPPTTTFMVGWHLRHGVAPAQRWVPRSKISGALALAVIAAEDQRFPNHAGFDFDAIEDALRERRQRGRVRGASTITQQVAKNLFLWSGRSWIRKALEVGLTAAIEWLWPKRRILEVYLNVAEFADGVFGAEAAARWVFHKPALALDATEAAQLAAVLPDPRTLDAANPSAYVLERRAWILSQMRALGGPRYLAEIAF
jgi:monofunctional biosynthetic peptidoglycan transglycosylase